MQTTRSRHYLLSLVCCALIMLLAACGTSSTPPSKKTVGATPTPTPTLPPVTTDCPVAGTARAAVMPPITLGTNQNVVYMVNEFHGNTPTFGTLKRYDTATGIKTEIIKLPDISISDAVLSADGQWLLFVAFDAKQTKLQLVRMDGQELQTLYCTQSIPWSSGASTQSSVSSICWSPDQQFALFNRTDSNLYASMYLLDMKSGSVQLKLKPPGRYRAFPAPYAWLDNTLAFLLAPGVDAPPAGLFLFDTSQDGSREFIGGDIHDVVGGNCWDGVLGIDRTQLFASDCTAVPNAHGPYTDGQRGPSTIQSIAPASGGSATTIYSSPTYAVTHVRVATSTTLLLTINTTSGSATVDPSHNGLWKINTDGSGLTYLTNKIDLNSYESGFNWNSEEPWSNVSRDGSMYTLETRDFSQKNASDILLVGSMNGGAPTPFASISDGTQLEVVGWTTM